MDPTIGAQESLSNFVIESNKFKKDELHFKAMMPGRDGERSLYRVDGLSDEHIAAWGQAFVANYRDAKVLGWGVLAASHIQAMQQQFGVVLKSDEPPHRHAVITNWPADPEKQRVVAMTLASKATARRWP
jgi:hypothetical protein